MTLLTQAIPFAGMAKKRDKDTKDAAPKRHQASFRFEEAFLARMERFSQLHPLEPTMTRIIELAVTDWLDKHEPELKKLAK